ncbi:MAG: GNAT family N-acetyltransferase [Saprospiraceae bacterium]
MFKELHAAIQSKQAGKIYWVLNQEGLAAAAVYMIWDNNTSYYWLPCLDKNVGSQGAAQLLLWHTIQEAFKMGKRYNFEGSMLPHIEPVFRAFGAERKPIHQLYKCSNRLLYAVRAFLKS